MATHYPAATSSLNSSQNNLLFPLLHSCGLFTTPPSPSSSSSQLRIAYCFLSSSCSIEEEEEKEIKALIAKESSCDILLTNYPYPSSSSSSSSSSSTTTTSSSSSLENDKRLSLLFGELLLALNPRYLFISHHTFSNTIARIDAPISSPSSSSSFPHPSKGREDLRIITLAEVSNSKEKEKKYLHALNLEPLPVQDTVIQIPAQKEEALLKRSLGDISSSATAAKKGRFANLEQLPTSSTSFFFQSPNAPIVPKPPNVSYPSYNSFIPGTSSGSSNDPNLPKTATLFVGGFPPKTQENELLSFFSSYRPVSISKQENKPFAFLTFPSSEAAQTVLQNAANFVFKGRSLTVNVAKEREKERRKEEGGMLNEPPSADHKIVFFGNVPHVATVQDILSQLGIEVREKDVVSIRRPEGKNFLFLEFSSYAMAAKIIELSQKGFF